MAAFDEADLGGRLGGDDDIADPVYPRPGGVDESAAPHFAPTCGGLELDVPNAPVRARRDEARPWRDGCAPLRRGAGVENHEPRIVDAAVPVGKAMGQLAAQRMAGMVAPQVERLGRGDAPALPEVVIEK